MNKKSGLQMKIYVNVNRRSRPANINKRSKHVNVNTRSKPENVKIKVCV